MTNWRDDIWDALVEAGVRQVAYVPDAGHKDLIEKCVAAEDIRAVSATTEEEGLAVLAGGWLGGQRGVMLMQSSGVGNCINMLSLNKTCAIPAVMLVTMRGEWGEFNTWQVPMGSTTQAHLELCGVHCYRCDQPEQVGETVRAGLRFAYQTNSSVAVLLAQKLIGAKVFAQGTPEGGR
jgi:sulfopyruvate decarboxylase alpha subunit